MPTRLPSPYCQDKNLLIAERTIAAALLVDTWPLEQTCTTCSEVRAAPLASDAVALLDVALNADNHVQLRTSYCTRS
jgi:hypothetical protein